jgi:DNA-binding NtrC family response regulator
LLAFVGRGSRRFVVARILVVDDEENQVRVLGMGLRLEGFEVAAARSADEAMAVLHADGDIQLCLFDLMMPGVNGLELARVVREKHPHVRVILTSAYHLSERQLARADCGVVGFVPKPYELNELAAFLRSKLSPPTSRTNLVRAAAAGSRLA